MGLPTADTSIPRSREAGATSQPAEPASYAFATATVDSTGIGTGSLRHRSPRVSPAEVAPNSDGTAQILEDLRILANWPRLRDASLPDPVVGGRDNFDPTGVADRLGIKGLSVYSAFIEWESYRCYVCGERSNGMAQALLHQRHRRHFQH